MPMAFFILEYILFHVQLKRNKNIFSKPEHMQLYVVECFVNKDIFTSYLARAFDWKRPHNHHLTCNLLRISNHS